jgi:hypothetical protein
MSILTAHTLLAEVGPDLSRFPNASTFSSWLGLCPDNDVTGGKKVAVGTRHVNNRAAWALRMAANALRNSRSALGDYYRRMRAKPGCPRPSPRPPTNSRASSSTCSPPTTPTTKLLSLVETSRLEGERRPFCETKPRRSDSNSFRFRKRRNSGGVFFRRR